MLATLGLLCAALPTAGQTPLPFRPGAILLHLTPMASPQSISFLSVQNGWRVERTLLDGHAMILQVGPGREAAALTLLRQTPGIDAAGLDYLAQATVEPNDPNWPQQWALPRIGAPAAWDIVTSTSPITIAIIDSGIALTHPDLASQLWSNPGEIPGNSLDDDSNGMVDDVHGWHYFHDSAYNPHEDANVQDDHGHGTHVAGIAAAATNNDLGIAGLAWNGRLMAVKVMDSYGTAWYSDIIAGIGYAADNGARVINLSLGGSNDSPTLCAAAAYAHQKGALLVAAAGNSGGPVLYPAACADVLAVGAIDQTDRRWDGSNRGPELALMAPGVDIYSTWYAAALAEDTYLTKTGTSMAAPHVAGAAALVWSRWPEWDNVAVSRQITLTTADRGAPGWDPEYGWGRLDACTAVLTPATTMRYRYYFPVVRREWSASDGIAP